MRFGNTVVNVDVVFPDLIIRGHLREEEISTVKHNNWGQSKINTFGQQVLICPWLYV
jgi:hypothetical protein